MTTVKLFNSRDYEYYYEYFMNTFMNTFLRVMNTMNTLRINSYFFKKNKSIETIIRNIIDWYVCVRRKSIHCIHQLIQSIHVSIHNLFIESFIFGG